MVTAGQTLFVCPYLQLFERMNYNTGSEDSSPEHGMLWIVFLVMDAAVAKLKIAMS